MILYVISWFLYLLKLKTMAWYDSTAEDYAIKDEENPNANLDIKIMIKELVSQKRPEQVLD